MWQSIAIGLRSVGRLIGDDEPARSGFQRPRRGARPAGARLRSAIRSPASPSSPPRLRGLLLGAGRRARAATPTPCARPVGVLGVGRRPGRRRRRARRGGHLGRRRDRRRRRLRADARPGVPRQHAAGAAPSPVRARRVRRRRADAAHVRAGDERPGHAPRTRRSCCARHRQPPPRSAGVEVRARALGRDRTSACRATRSCGWSRRCGCSTGRPTSPTCRAFFAEHPIPQGQRTLEQILERQRVNADVRERNEASLLADVRLSSAHVRASCIQGRASFRRGARAHALLP